MTYRLILFFCFIWAGIQSFIAQSENQLVKSSSSFFEKKQYSLAIDGYLQLLSNDLKNVEYNYCYGVCLFYTQNPKSSETYFNYILEQPQFPEEAFYFKGRLYHLNYEFDKAIEMYSNYIALKTKKSQNLGALEEIQRCQNAKELLKSPRAIQVIRQDQRNTEDYFSAYLFDSINYKLYSQEDFGKKYNTKRGFNPKYVFKRGMKYRFFSSYSNNIQSGKDIFYQKKNTNNNWDTPQRLSLAINTLLDEDFPFYDERSGYLYFSSTGHNSMGGYDLFRIKFSLNTLQAEKVENLNFPYSSTANDFLFVPNLPGENVIFATDRNQNIGGISVVEARFNAPVLSSLVASLYFEDNIDPQNSEAVFFVTNELSKEKFGPFNTNARGALYFIVPAPGAYLIEASIHGSDLIFEDTIDIPPHVEGFEFEVNASYQMKDSREAMSYNQNLIQISDMVVDIETIELHEFEKLTVNTKTIDAVAGMTIAMESKPLRDSEIDTKINYFIDLEVDLEDQIRQKIKLTENINELYSKTDEVDRKIDYIINQNISNTEKELDSLNPILYDLLVDRKIVVSSLIDQKEYNDSMKDLGILQELYSELTEFNKAAELMREAGNKDSLSRMLRSKSIFSESIVNGLSLSAKVRKELLKMESDQIEIQVRINSKKTELETFSHQKSELAIKLKVVSNLEAWGALSDSIDLIEQRIYDVGKDIRVLTEKYEILEGQMIYAREGLLNITLIDADGNDLENDLQVLNNEIDIDKYASTELFARDKVEASQSLKNLKRNQTEERLRVRSSALNKVLQDTIMLASEYEHLKALDQFDDQEDLVAKNQVNTLIKDSELIINSLSKSTLEEEPQLVSNTFVAPKDESVVITEVTSKETDLAIISPAESQEGQIQEANDRKTSELKAQDINIESSIKDEVSDLIKTQDVIVNSVNPQSAVAQSTNSYNNSVNNKTVITSQEKSDSQIVSNVNIDETQSSSLKTKDDLQPTNDFSNSKITKEAIVGNNSSIEDQNSRNYDDVRNVKRSESSISERLSKDVENKINKSSDGTVRVDTQINNRNLMDDDQLVSIVDKNELKRDTNDLNAEETSSNANAEVLTKVSSTDEHVKNNESPMNAKESLVLSNVDFEKVADPIQDPKQQEVLNQAAVDNTTKDILTVSKKVIPQEGIGLESQNNSVNAPSNQQDQLSNSKEESIAEVRADLKATTENETMVDLTQNIIDPLKVDEKNMPMENSSVQPLNKEGSQLVTNEPSKQNENDQRSNAEYTSQSNLLENEIVVMNQQEKASSIKVDSDRAISEIEKSSQLTNTELTDQEVEKAQTIDYKIVQAEEENNLSNSEISPKENDLIADKSTSIDGENINPNSEVLTQEDDLIAQKGNSIDEEKSISNSEALNKEKDSIAEKSTLIEEKLNNPNSKTLPKENDLIAPQRSSFDENNQSYNLNQNSDGSITSFDENEIESQRRNEVFNARVETLRFDNNEVQGPEFSESVKLLTALILDAEIEINEEISEPEPKRKKDLELAINRREAQERRLAYFQNELNLELTNQNIENKYLRLKSILPGVQFETVDNLNAQLLEIEIKEQDLLNRLSRTTSQNEMNMLNRLIEANRSRKLMIEEELIEMQSFERNELRVATRALNDKEIASIISSESYLSYVEKRQKLQEANDLLNQLKLNNRDSMMAFDASLRLSVNAKSLTEEQKQMVKEIRQLQQAIVYLEEEVKLRSSSLGLETASAEHEYLYQNAMNPSISDNSSTLPTLKELSDLQLAAKVQVENNKGISSEKEALNNSILSEEDSINSSLTNNERANVSKNVSNPLQYSSNSEGETFVSEDISGESEFISNLFQIKDPLSVLESGNYKSYVQDRMLANLLAQELRGFVDISSSSNSLSKSQAKNSISKEAEAELILKSAIDKQISRNTDDKQNISLTESELETTFNYVNEQKLTLIRTKLDRVMKSIGSYDSSIVYEALLRNEFMESIVESTASLQKSLKSLDLVDYSENELIQSDFTVLKQEVISKNSEVFEIGNSNPSGLNFRVQVGAFRRPVRQDVYREFTPVSGQTLDNGLIVYMAGYFNNSNSAVAAQKQIRSFGYSDAFIVAYCNDERLAFWKGKEYEKNGKCIAKGNNSFLALDKSINSKVKNKIRENNAALPTESMGVKTSTESGNLSSILDAETSELPSEYNRRNQRQFEQEKNANEATNNYSNTEEAEEERNVGGIDVSGLFYSVQVGAFNRKIRGSELSKIRELDFYESSGLYRYSSGKFLTIDEARLRRVEVVNNGISDAFLVVFYNGKRITMQEARDLLSKNGSSVLFSKKEKVNRSVTETNRLGNESINQQNVASKLISVKEVPKTAQIISAQRHTVKIIEKAKAPLEKMIIYSLETDSLDKNSIERLNRVGVFHFNKDSLKIKSQAFEASSINSMLSFYTNGMKIDKFDSDQFVIHTIKMNLTMDGAFGDWLLRSKRTIGFTRLNKDIYLNFYLTSEAEKDLLISELKEIRNN